MKFQVMMLSAALGLSLLGATQANASVVMYDFNGAVNGDPYSAQVSLDVSGGQATSGMGSITGAGLTGTQSLTLVTLASPGVENDGGGLLGYRSNDGTDVFDADTSVPIDANGLIFAIGPNPVGYETSQQFTVYKVGAGYDAGFFGAASSVAPQYYSFNDAVSVAIAAVPEPATWAMMLLGFFGLGAALRMSRRRQPAIVATA